MDNFSDGALTESVKEIPKPYRDRYRHETSIRDLNTSLDWAIGLVETVNAELGAVETETEAEAVMSKYRVVLESNEALVEQAKSFIARCDTHDAIVRRNQEAIDELFMLADIEPVSVSEFTQLFNRYLQLASQVSGETALTQQTRNAAEDSRLKLIADYPELFAEFQSIMATVVSGKEAAN